MSPLKSLRYEEVQELDEIVGYIHSDLGGKELFEKFFLPLANKEMIWKRLRLIPYFNFFLLFDQIKLSDEEKKSFFDVDFFQELYDMFPLTKYSSPEAKGNC